MKVIHAFYNKEGDKAVGRPPHTLTVVYQNDAGVDRALVLSLEILIKSLGTNDANSSYFKQALWEGRSSREFGSDEQN